MVRQFKYHEQKLLKKVDFLNVRTPRMDRPLALMALSSVEARCKPSRDQGHAEVPHPGQRGLPQVCLLRISLLPQCLTTIQIQQTMWLAAFLRAPPLAPARARPLPRTHGGAAALQALRHRRAQLPSKAQRRREQAHRRRVLPSPARGDHDGGQDGRDGQRGASWRYREHADLLLTLLGTRR